MKTSLVGWTYQKASALTSANPFSIIDSGALGTLAGLNYGPAGTAILASAVGAIPLSCGSSAVNTPCFTTSQFAPSGPSGFGTLGRN